MYRSRFHRCSGGIQLRGIHDKSTGDAFQHDLILPLPSLSAFRAGSLSADGMKNSLGDNNQINLNVITTTHARTHARTSTQAQTHNEGT